MSTTAQQGAQAPSLQDCAYLIHLIDCALHDRTPEPIGALADWRRVGRLAAHNSVEAMTGLAALRAPGAPRELAAAWREKANETLYRRLQFDAERETVFAALAQEGLSYLPLKGSVLADYYPHPEMRSMADNDFLYGFVEPLGDAANTGAQDAPVTGWRVVGTSEREREQSMERGISAMVRVMERLGYRTVSTHAGCHESFEKPPCFFFEPHRRLMAPASPMASYYENPWARARQDEHEPHLFRFGASDEYVYLLAHAFKHFDQAGCGIRYVVDLRVFVDARGSELDWPYIDKQLEALGLTDFERASRGLADAAFCGQSTADGAELTEDETRLAAHLLGSGTYGTHAQLVERKLARELVRHDGNARAARRSYLWGRVTDPEAIRALFPRASRHRALYPLLVLARLVVKGAGGPGKVAAELRQLHRAR